MFAVLKNELIAYLRNEVTARKIKIIESIKTELTSDTFAINFNYTDTAEMYTDHNFYVHGSIKEDNIVLGYDYQSDRLSFYILVQSAL